MLLQPVILGSQNAMNAVDGATIELRIRISRPGEGRGRCKGSRAWDPRKDFSQCMQPPIIRSTSSAISPQQERTEPSGHRPCIHGTKSSLRREPNGPGDLLRALFGNVTEPFPIQGWLTFRQAVRRVSRMKGVTHGSMSSVQLCRRFSHAGPVTARCEAGMKAQGDFQPSEETGQGEGRKGEANEPSGRRVVRNECRNVG
jgi:hypothetical protein